MSLSDLGVAPLAVNGYLWDTLKAIEPTFDAAYGQKTPIFPLGDSASGSKSWGNKTYIVYDRMFKLGYGAFYPKKSEQILYYVKGNETDSLLWGSAIQIILDREDDAGKDINQWIRDNGGNEEYPVYFHYIRVNQTGTYSLGGGRSSLGEAPDSHFIYAQEETSRERPCFKRRRW